MEGILYPISTAHYLVLGAALFLIGTLGVLVRRNLVVVLMSVELMMNGVNINLVTFSHLWGDVQGQIFGIFIIAIAVAEAAIGLGILIALFRNKMSVQADEMEILKW